MAAVMCLVAGESTLAALSILCAFMTLHDEVQIACQSMHHVRPVPSSSWALFVNFSTFCCLYSFFFHPNDGATVTFWLLPCLGVRKMWWTWQISTMALTSLRPTPDRLHIERLIARG